MRFVVAKTGMLVVAALSAAPSFAHALEAYPRLMIWPPELWREATVFNAQFLLFAAVGAPIDLLAILGSAGLTFALRGRKPRYPRSHWPRPGLRVGPACWPRGHPALSRPTSRRSGANGNSAT